MFGRCEELLTAQDIEIYKPQHVSHFVNADTMNTVEHLVQVIESYTDPSQSSVEGNGLKEAEMGNETDLTVITRDSDGNQRYNEEDRVTVQNRLSKGQNEEMKIEDLQNGKYAVRYKPKSVGLHDIDVEVNGKPLTGSPWRVLVTGHQYKALHSFGSPGEGPGEFNRPDSIVVSERTGNIAIADNASANCVKVFNKGGEFQYDIGAEGSGDGQLKRPAGLAIDNFNNLIVCDSLNRRLQVFSLDGKFVFSFNEGIQFPCSIAVTKESKVVVSDIYKDIIHVFR